MSASLSSTGISFNLSLKSEAYNPIRSEDLWFRPLAEATVGVVSGRRPGRGHRHARCLVGSEAAMQSFSFRFRTVHPSVGQALSTSIASRCFVIRELRRELGGNEFAYSCASS